LFADDIKEKYERSLAQAGAAGLRIRLISETPDLAAIPWDPSLTVPRYMSF
jgi:hypothetical protein